MADQGFPKKSRLLSEKDFNPVFSRCQFRLSNRLFLILAIYNPGPDSRLGIVVPKKNIDTAVQRNRIKRIIRESFRLTKADFATIDLVVLVKKGPDGLSNKEIRDQLETLFAELSARDGRKRT